jgi:hypothetical protein
MIAAGKMIAAIRGHGERAALFIESLRGSLLHLKDEDFLLLYEAIRDHELGLTRGNVTVITCWDADRLDLGRVRTRPNPGAGRLEPMRNGAAPAGHCNLIYAPTAEPHWQLADPPRCLPRTPWPA